MLCNLDELLSAGEVRRLFEPYGRVISVHKTLGMGAGFVLLESREQAVAAHEALDNLLIGTKHMRVFISKSAAAVKGNEVVDLRFF